MTGLRGVAALLNGPARGGRLIGSGTGTLNGDFVLLNGSVMLSGKGSVPKDTF